MRRVAVAAGLVGLVSAALWSATSVVPPSATLPKPAGGNTVATKVPVAPTEVGKPTVAVAPVATPAPAAPAPVVVLDAVPAAATLTAQPKPEAAKEIAKKDQSPVRPVVPSAPPAKTVAAAPPPAVVAPVPFMEPPTTPKERPILAPKNGDIPGHAVARPAVIKPIVEPVVVEPVAPAVPVTPVRKVARANASDEPAKLRGGKASARVSYGAAYAPQFKASKPRSSSHTLISYVAPKPMPAPAARFAPQPRVQPLVR